MKIYHTETQADYDALMVELEEQGYKWISGDEPSQVNAWKVYKNQIGILMDNSTITHSSLDYLRSKHPDTPIIKYKSKADEKMKFTKENVLNLTDKWIESKIISFQDLQNEIKELDDTPEKVVVPKYVPKQDKPVIPQFVADWYEENLSGSYTDNRNKFSGNDVFRVIQDVLKTSEGLKTWGDYGIDKEITVWAEENEEDFIHLIANCSYKDGYTIEPEQLYYIPLPHLETTDGIQQVLSQRKGDKNYFASRPAETLKQRFTKEELERVPEIYKPYAKPIEEEEEE